MTGFGDWLVENMIDQSDSLLPIAREVISQNPGLPAPTRLLSIGNSQGHVYDTADPHVVLRIAPSHHSECEKTLADPRLQDTGGVVKIHALHTADSFTLTWKEKVNTDLKSTQLPFRLRRLLSGLYAASPEELEALDEFPATQPLALALRSGLPLADLDIAANLGLTSDGRVVAYDC